MKQRNPAGVNIAKKYFNKIKGISGGERGLRTPVQTFSPRL
jgi:hypothetical protein